MQKKSILNITNYFARLTAICEKIIHGEYEEAKKIFALPPCENPESEAGILAEALGMMLVRIEAREFELGRTISELTATREELLWHKERLDRENRRLREELRKKSEKIRPIASAPSMLPLLRQAERSALVDTTLLITGETGTGKGVFAKYIHSLSSRSSKPFIAINCAAIPATLLESELFGIESGVASGVHARIGRFEQAAGGTILLDEIGDMPLESQAKLLSVIETGTVERVGGRKPIQVGVRIIAATHRELENWVDEGKFRQDLFYRLNVMRLHIPPLRERREDIPLLARHFLTRLAGRYPIAPLRVSPEAMGLLQNDSWPGNIREFENELERSALLAEGPFILPCDLSPIRVAHVSSPPSTHQEAGNGCLSPSSLEASAVSAVTGEVDPTDGEDQSIRTLAEVEAAYILTTLRRLRGNKSKAAKILGISREGLRLKLDRARAHRAG